MVLFAKENLLKGNYTRIKYFRDNFGLPGKKEPVILSTSKTNKILPIVICILVVK